MIRRPIKQSEIAFIRRHFQAMTSSQMGAALGRTKNSVKTIMRRHGFRRPGRLFTPVEAAWIKAYPHRPAREIASCLGRTVASIHYFRFRYGIGRKRAKLGKSFEDFIREKHLSGWSDSEIAGGWGCERHTVGKWRARLGLPDNRLSAHNRQRVAEKTRAQFTAAGCKSLGELRVKAFREYATRHGWPSDLRPRAVQILNAIYRTGPMTRRQIAAEIGMPWHGSDKSLVSNDPEGTYLANLMRRGLVIKLERAVKGKGRGRSVSLYTVPLSLERNSHGQAS